MAATTNPRRRRRSPEVAEREILDAAQSFLHERQFRELTVDEVMRRTDLSRPSFYVYFRDRHHLLLRVVEHIGGELFAMADRWFKGDGDPTEELRAGLQGVVTAFTHHGPVLRALSDAATDDHQVELAYGGLVQAFVDATSAHIEEQMGRGEIPPMNACETGLALVLMTERYLIHSFGRPGQQADAEVVTETLFAIWARTLYTTV